MPRLGRWAWIVVSIVLGAVLLVNQGFRNLISNYLAIHRLQYRLTASQKEEGQLHSDIDRLRKDDAALEGAARKELGYLKRGEVEYRFPPPQQ